MWYWKTPRNQSRIYFSTARAACEDLTTKVYMDPILALEAHRESMVVFIPDTYSYTGREILKIGISWNTGHAFPNIPLFANERRDREESERILGAK